MSIETTAKILIVDDDSFLRDVLAFALGRSGFHVIGAADPATALNLVAAEAPALVILDVNLEPWDGFDLLDELRRRSDTPVIMLTQRSSEQERVRGLECGADDYITKPFSHHELRARIGAVLRRSAKPPPSPTLLTVGPLRMDLVRRQVMKNGLLVRLRAMEFKVLQCLMERPGLVVSRGSCSPGCGGTTRRRTMCYARPWAGCAVALMSASAVARTTRAIGWSTTNPASVISSAMIARMHSGPWPALGADSSRPPLTSRCGT
ncbi:MAG: response regulator transcription factor [Dehalococcoidia bacterium]